MSCAAADTVPGKVWGAGDDVLELGDVDGAILVDVRLLQDLKGEAKASGELCVAGIMLWLMSGLMVLTFWMSCSISALLSRDSSPCPVRQFTSFSRSFLSRVPSSSKSLEKGKLCFVRATATPESREERAWQSEDTASSTLHLSWCTASNQTSSSNRSF